MLRVLFAILVMLSAISGVQAAEKTYGDVQAVIESVYDGDTITVSIPSWPPVIGERIGVRVFGIDTPEMKDKRPEIKAMARRAKDVVLDLLLVGGPVILKNLRRDKYFRLLADVETVDGRSVGVILLEAGLAHAYDGGKKAPW